MTGTAFLAGPACGVPGAERGAIVVTVAPDDGVDPVGKLGDRGKGVWEDPRAATPTDDKEATCNVEYLGSIPGLGRSPGEGNGYPLQYSGLENSVDCMVHGVAKSQT